MLNIVLFSPEKPANTGNIGRSCVLSRSRLHLIRPFCFRMDDRSLRRAGLDYWPHLDLYIHDSYEAFLEYAQDSRIYYATTKTNQRYTDIKYCDGDYIVFGPESSGIPESILKENWERTLTIPMDPTYARSLNLSNAANIVLFEALRQLDFQNLK